MRKCIVRHCLPDRNRWCPGRRGRARQACSHVHSSAAPRRRSPPTRTRSRPRSPGMGQRVDLDQVAWTCALRAAGHGRAVRRVSAQAPGEMAAGSVVRWGRCGPFRAKYRTRLFPHTPVIYAGMDLRTLPPGPSATPPSSPKLNVARLVEDILQLAPDTTNIGRAGAYRLNGIGRSSFAARSSLSQTA